MFKADNTEGFTAAELDILNEVLSRMIAEGWDEQNAQGHISDAWIEGDNSAAALYERAAAWQYER